jgi:5-hydroxyisourate hydrolase
MSKITTHILDTAKGCPAEGVRVILYAGEMEMASGTTDKNGRISEWPGPNADAAPGVAAFMAAGNGIYKMRFETKDYFDKQSVPTFYPFVEVHFELTADGHYHIPLLVSPFGYSTYRGS